jgi:hypothetical protein
VFFLPDSVLPEPAAGQRFHCVRLDRFVSEDGLVIEC